MSSLRLPLLIVCLLGCVVAVGGAQPAPAPAQYLLKPARVFDGTRMREGVVVHVRGDRIVAIGTAAEVTAAGAEVIDLPGTTLMPGLIDAHSHILLHAYNEAPWNNQVLNEAQSLRVARAVNHLKATLDAGFTTLRDLGTEGAGYADVGLKQAVNQGIIPGPRLLVATRALVATGSYAPKGFAPEWSVPQGAQEADGADELVKAVREQIG
ncbi:MAG: amidohydrolase family protein, partial [Vicinamibacterales bacterium]